MNEVYLLPLPKDLISALNSRGQALAFLKGFHRQRAEISCAGLLRPKRKPPESSDLKLRHL